MIISSVTLCREICRINVYKVVKFETKELKPLPPTAVTAQLGIASNIHRSSKTLEKSIFNIMVSELGNVISKGRKIYGNGGIGVPDFMINSVYPGEIKSVGNKRRWQQNLYLAERQALKYAEILGCDRAYVALGKYAKVNEDFAFLEFIKLYEILIFSSSNSS
ncbi:hypothetical protein [Stygiolobus caldivivus]|uniref:Uncharacterized protein n=1 Tax=Stygiolobus caldivivus TaxID=2824673 RepID=A0A8D5U5Q2_9CREN|nr:hypothetical protein [Stygiolobus caldivivus]BCU69971.1 hypothetical protein KN1_12680 [Stygiolobus caldivivus]